MKIKDLTEKLEKLEVPELNIESHRVNLRRDLLNSGYFDKKPGFWGVITKPLAFSVPVMVLSLVLGFVVFRPGLGEAEALSIAGADPEIQKIMEENNMVLSDVKIKDGTAYVLMNPFLAEKTDAIKITKQDIGSGDKNDSIEGAIVEVNLKQKKVLNIKHIRGDEVAPLAEEEKESAERIIRSEEILENMIPKDAEIEEIRSFLPEKMDLVDKNNDGVEAVAKPKSERKASVRYTRDGKKWIVQVNLDEKKVEEVRYSRPVRDEDAKEENNDDDFRDNKGRENNQSINDN